MRRPHRGQARRVRRIPQPADRPARIEATLRVTDDVDLRRRNARVFGLGRLPFATELATRAVHLLDERLGSLRRPVERLNAGGDDEVTIRLERLDNAIEAPAVGRRAV